MPIETNGQLLVRMNLAAKGFAEANWLDSEPLFLNEPDRPPPIGIEPPQTWRLQRKSAEDHAWDAAHAFATTASEQGVSVFAEPDLLHRHPIK